MGRQVYDVDATALPIRPRDADAMVSRAGGLGARGSTTADCVPLSFRPAGNRGQIAAIHAGWQGAGVRRHKGNRRALLMPDKPITAWIRRCISQENYEVGSQVRDKLLAGCVVNQVLSSQHLESFEQRYVSATSVADKIKLNLPSLPLTKLRAAGITVSNQSEIPCSYADSRYLLLIDVKTDLGSDLQPDVWH